MSENQTPGPVESLGEPTFEDVVRVGKVESDGIEREGFVHVRTAVSKGSPSGWGHLFNTVARESGGGRWQMFYSNSDSMVVVAVPSGELLGDPGLDVVVAALDTQIANTNTRHRETVLPSEVEQWNERVQDERNRLSVQGKVKARLKAYNDSQG